MRSTKTHKELIKTWDTKTLRNTVESLREHVSDLQRDREDYSKWQRRLDECETELLQR